MIANTQQFNASGTWFRPGGASFVDVTLSGGAALFTAVGLTTAASRGELVSQRFVAAELPREVKVHISDPDGYALVITHRE